MKRLVPTLLLLVPLSSGVAPPGRASSPDVLSDTVYNASHPRLLFDTSDVPGLYAKVRDGGLDDLAYLYIRNRVANVYAYLSLTNLLENDYGLEQIANLGLATFLEAPYDTSARDLGKDLTLVIADSFAVDDDCYASSLRLRNLSLGYDLFFSRATLEERARVRDEIEGYLTYMLASASYAVWHYRPYVSNQTAMLSAALGLAGIGLNVELDPALASAARSAAHQYFYDWIDAQLEVGGAYREGLLYGLWSMRHLVYYFHARERFDGTDYSLFSPVRDMEEWLAYELDPRGLGRVNNIQDCTDAFRPLARHTTYLDWAQSKWGSELAAYIFLHGPGGFGVDMGDNADKAGTVLWSQPIAAADPAATLPKNRLWTGRGLYYYRTGWPLLFDSDDAVFSFYSGVFQGGHAQEDQNQFTLTAYGEKLVTDHGAGSIAKDTEAHNLVLIDGAGQHHAGYSVGTDGRIVSCLLGDYMDYLVGDATAAYTTYSPYNENGNPFPDTDWTWGHKGANPVLFALRKVVVVHEAESRPYFVIFDDIDKDGLVHTYQWRLHTHEDNAVDATDNPVHVTGDTGAMEVFVVNPCFDSLAVAVAPFDNLADDDNSNLITLSASAVNPRFATILLPRAASDAPPVITAASESGRAVTTIDWRNGYQDLVVVAVGDSSGPVQSIVPVGSNGESVSIVTDAEVAVVRLSGSSLVRYLMADGSTLWFEGVEQVAIGDGAASVSKSQDAVHIDRPDAEFVIYAPQDLPVYSGGVLVQTVRQGSYLLPSATSGAVDAPRRGGLVSVRAFPNPFNPDVSVVIRAQSATSASAEVFDAAGRRVARVWSGRLAAGDNSFAWNGIGDDGALAASGVYFLRVTTPTGAHTVKILLLK